MHSLLILALLLLAACAKQGELADSANYGPPYHFNVTGLPEHYQVWVTAGVKNWNDKAGMTLAIIDPSGPHRFQIAPLAGPYGLTRCRDGVCLITISSAIYVGPPDDEDADPPESDIQDTATLTPEDGADAHDFLEPLIGAGEICHWPEFNRAVIGHELGHAFKVYFTNNPGDPVHSENHADIMHNLAACIDTPTDRDVAALPENRTAAQ